MRLPDSPKIEAKGVILVRGPWYETLGSLDFLFTFNRTMSFPGVFKLWDLYVVVLYPTYFLNKHFFMQGKGEEVDW